MLQKTQGIVLSSIKYSESSIIARIFTEDFGKLSFLVHGVRKNKSRMPASLFQSFTLVQLDINYKNKSKLHNIREISVAQRTDFLHSDIRKSTIALFLAEILHKSLEENQQDQGLFDFIKLSITFLDSVEKSYANFHLIFLIQLSKYLGFFPNQMQAAKFDFFDMESGTFESKPHHDQFLNRRQSLQLKKLMQLSYLEREDLSISNSERRELLKELIRYYQLHLPGLGKISSLEILESVFE